MLAKVANSITAQYSVTFARPDTSPAKGVKWRPLAAPRFC